VHLAEKLCSFLPAQPWNITRRARFFYCPRAKIQLLMLAGGCVTCSARTHNTLYQTRNIKERKAAALGVPRERVLWIKVLLRAGPGVCRLREKLARSITSLAPALTLTFFFDRCFSTPMHYPALTLAPTCGVNRAS
jgi:hypothetical protein